MSFVAVEQLYRALRHGTSEVAVKHIPCLAEDPQRLRHLMQREIAIMKRISYDRNIVQFCGACSADDGAWVCMELMEVSVSMLHTDVLLLKRHPEVKGSPHRSGGRSAAEVLLPLTTEACLQQAPATK